MDENKTSKMSKSDKIVNATAFAVIVGAGVGYGVFVRKQHLAYVKALKAQNIMLDKALGETISLVAEALKK